jgi:hypothetical protein
MQEESDSMVSAIKAQVCDPRAKTFAFIVQKTMYGGKHIAQGDTVFVFASENEGGHIARGIVTSAQAIAGAVTRPAVPAIRWSGDNGC